MATKAANAAPMTGNIPSTTTPGFIPPPAMPQDPVSAASVASEYIRKDPNSLKTVAQMMQNMPVEQLEAMASSMPGGAGMPKMDAEQVKMAAKMMETMTPEDLEQMTKLAQSMHGMPGMGPTGNAQPGGAQPAVDFGAGNATAAMPRAPSVAGAAPHFDVGAGGMNMNMSGDMMANMRRQMADPAMLKSMQSMFKSMDPEALAGMMKSTTGKDMTPEQAKKMVDSMGNVGGRTLEWVARLAAVINWIIDVYSKVKAWAMSNGAMAIALVLLIMVVLMRLFGWV